MPCDRMMPGHWIVSANACRRMSDSKSASFFQCSKFCCSESERPAHGKQNIPAHTSALAGRLSTVLCTGDFIGIESAGFVGIDSFGRDRRTADYVYDGAVARP